jgi:hypothetical protein
MPDTARMKVDDPTLPGWRQAIINIPSTQDLSFFGVFFFKLVFGIFFWKEMYISNIYNDSIEQQQVIRQWISWMARSTIGWRFPSLTTVHEAKEKSHYHVKKINVDGDHPHFSPVAK